MSINLSVYYFKFSLDRSHLSLAKSEAWNVNCNSYIKSNKQKRRVIGGENGN